MSVYKEPIPEVLDLDHIAVSVFGLGKMGLPLAAVLADHGATVNGVDIDPDVVAAVNDGTSPVENEPGLDELIREHGGNRLEATTDGAGAAAAADIHIILVPTVVDDDHELILEPVLAAASAIGEGVTSDDLVILESTVPPGTTAQTLTEAVTPDGGSIEPGVDFGVAYCPERTYAGKVIEDLMRSYPKVVGGIDDRSTRGAASLYRAFNEPGVQSMESATAAEAVKVFEGVYRDVNIALANELAKACQEWGIDSEPVFATANGQPFCDIHRPGIGVGGHCIPVYPHFVINNAADTPLLQTARAINDEMPVHTVDTLEALLNGHDRPTTDANVLVLGVAYRAGVAEARYAPAVDAIEELGERGATIYANDPLLADSELESFGATPVGDPHDVPDLDGIILATGHEEYETLSLDTLAETMRTPIVVDGRRFFDPAEMDAFTYATIGDGTQASSRRNTR